MSRSYKLFWRRERDSNPRYAINVYSLSRGALSTTQPSLRILFSSLRSPYRSIPGSALTPRCARRPAGALRASVGTLRVPRFDHSAISPNSVFFPSFTVSVNPGERFDSSLRSSPCGRTACVCRRAPRASVRPPGRSLLVPRARAVACEPHMVMTGCRDVNPVAFRYDCSVLSVSGPAVAAASAAFSLWMRS